VVWGLGDCKEEVYLVVGDGKCAVGMWEVVCCGVVSFGE